MLTGPSALRRHADRSEQCLWGGLAHRSSVLQHRAVLEHVRHQEQQQVLQLQQVVLQRRACAAPPDLLAAARMRCVPPSQAPQQRQRAPAGAAQVHSAAKLSRHGLPQHQGVHLSA